MKKIQILTAMVWMFYAGAVPLFKNVNPANSSEFLDKETEAHYRLAKANFLEHRAFDLGEIFYNPIKEDEKNNPNVEVQIRAAKQTTNLPEKSIESKKLGEYYFYTEAGKKVMGILLGTEHTNSIQLENLITNLSKDIQSKRLFSEIRASISDHSFSVGNAWTKSHSYKLTWSLDYEGMHYGDFSEWHDSYYAFSNNDIYRMFTHETYSAPNRKDGTDDFRTANIKYHFDPSDSRISVRDYAPKNRNPEVQISYSSDIGAELSSNGDVKISASVSSSYSTILNSPVIHDYGNMANNIVEIDFEYVNPWTEDKPWYSYNTEQSMQTAMYIFKENRFSQSHATVKDYRTITMVRDDFWAWNDRIVNFNYNYSLNL